MMVHMYCLVGFVVLGFVGEVLGVVVLLVLVGVSPALVAVVTGHNNIYFLFLRAFFYSLFSTW
jgi:hypothetical protein